MALKRNENNKKTKAPARGRLPVKRTINLATVGEKPVNPFIAVPAIVLIVVAAALFSKIAVIDRMVKVSQAQAEVSYLQSQIDAGYERIESFGELVEEYAHYTYSGMTEEELQRVDRDDVMEMLQRVVLPEAQVETWTLVGNELNLPITDTTLQKINLLVQQLNQEPMVDFCTVSTAATNDRNGSQVVSDANARVTAQVTVYLKQVEEDVE